MSNRMEKMNRYGLVRSQLTLAIKREVRQRCGFGCIKCGNALIQYEHFDPPFEHAKEHNPNGITLLCAGCHDKKTRGYFSEEQIKKWNQQPFCKINIPTCSFSFLPPMWVVMGSTLFTGSGTIIEANNTPILSINIKDGEALLQAMFKDQSGKLALHVVDNEVFFMKKPWDIEMIGGKICIRSGYRKVIFQAELFPPSGLVIKSINIKEGGVAFCFNTDGMTVDSTNSVSLKFEGAITLVNGCIQVNKGNSTIIRDGFAYIPYPIERFNKLSTSGDIEQLYRQLMGMVINVYYFNESWVVDIVGELYPKLGIMGNVCSVKIYANSKEESISIAEDIMKYDDDDILKYTYTKVHHGNGFVEFKFKQPII